MTGHVSRPVHTCEPYSEFLRRCLRAGELGWREWRKAYPR